MPKKLLVMIIAACMTISMVACGSSEDSVSEKNSSSDSSTVDESTREDDSASDNSESENEKSDSEKDTSKDDSSVAETSEKVTETPKATETSEKVTETPKTTQAPTATSTPKVTQAPKTTTKVTQAPKTTTKTVAKTTTKVTTNPTPDSTLVPRNAFDKPTGKYMAAMKKISKVNAHINKDFTESDCALVREYLIDLVYKKYPKSKAHNVKFIPYFDKNGKPSYYDSVLNNGGSYNGANWQYYYGIDEGQIQMFIDEMTYLADVYMYNFNGEPCINGCTNWDIFWMYRSDGAVRFSLAVF